jgi:hypothetical protein
LCDAWSFMLNDCQTRFRILTLDDSHSAYLRELATATGRRDTLIPTLTYSDPSKWSSVYRTSTGFSIDGPRDEAQASEEKVVQSGVYYNNSVSFTTNRGSSATYTFKGELSLVVELMFRYILTDGTIVVQGIASPYMVPPRQHTAVQHSK